MIQLRKIMASFVKDDGQYLNEIVIEFRPGEGEESGKYEIWIQAGALLLSRNDTEKLARLLLLITEDKN